ncbi:hypothetical protein QUF72_18365 [Desulfobacterales bacterium HSG2]|nr:hypothetical protein [Desulfobacterales bacterium HSG2]
MVYLDYIAFNKKIEAVFRTTRLRLDKHFVKSSIKMDSDPDDSARISVYYDTDSTGNDGILIASAGWMRMTRRMSMLGTPRMFRRGILCVRGDQ